MKKTRKSVEPISADAIARLADQGKDISHFFNGQGRMVQPIQRVNLGALHYQVHNLRMCRHTTAIRESTSCGARVLLFLV